MKTFIVNILLLLIPICGFSQMENIHFAYEDIKLGQVFNDLQERYDVQFSYSSNFIPIDKKVSAQVNGISLPDALDELFTETQIVYKIIKDNKVLLKVDPDKSLNSLPLPRAIIAAGKPRKKTFKKSRKQKKLETEKKLKRKAPKIDAIHIPKPKEIKTSGKQCIPTFELERLTRMDSSMHKREMTQLSILPNISTNSNDAYATTHKVSANIFLGINGGVSGVEIGGIGNIVIKDVKGFQFAGVFNQVKGNVQGTQISGGINYNKLNTRGIQIAGLANVNSQANAIQSAGLFNYVSGQFSGIQIAGLANIVRGKATALQIAGLSNFNQHNAQTQIAGFLNRAQYVKKSQISGFLNIAKKIEGNQIGLVNYCNSIDGSTYGLINIVKNGYNVIELSGNLVLENGLAFKMGSKGFYNIFQVNKSYRNAWGLGYGLGTTIDLPKQLSSHAEVLLVHINENTFWTKPLNLMLQTRYHIDYRLHKKWHLFFGPNISLLTSKIKNTEGNLIGSTLPVYHFINKNTDNLNMKMWAGFNAGVRYRL